MTAEASKRLKLACLTASAVSVLLAAQWSVAADDSTDYNRDQQAQQEQEGGEIPNASTGSIFPDRSEGSEAFAEVDRDGDGTLRWQEIQAAHGDALEGSEWEDRQEVFAEFDESNDQLLNAEEYEEFRSAALEQERPAGGDNTAFEGQSDRADRQSAEAEQDPRWQSEEQVGQSRAEEQQADEAVLSLSVEDIVDAEVINSEGDEIGSVSRVVRDDQSGDLALVLESGGTLGVGGNRVLIPLNEVSQLGESRLLWDTTLGEDEIADVPEFDGAGYTEISAGDYENLEEASRG